MIKKIWNDPVWSKVISAAILAAIVWISSGWWPVWVIRKISSFWLGLLSYLSSSIAVPHWLILLFCGVFVIVGLPAVIAIASNLFSKDVTSRADWRSYTTDTFEGLRWRWRYQDRAIATGFLAPFCTVCDLQVIPRDHSGTVSFYCENCRNLVDLEGSYGYLENRVIRLIEQKIRAENWPAAGQV